VKCILDTQLNYESVVPQTKHSFRAINRLWCSTLSFGPTHNTWAICSACQTEISQKLLEVGAPEIQE